MASYASSISREPGEKPIIIGATVAIAATPTAIKIFLLSRDLSIPGSGVISARYSPQRLALAVGSSRPVAKPLSSKCLIVNTSVWLLTVALVIKAGSPTYASMCTWLRTIRIV